VLPFPAGSQFGGNPKPKPLKINDEWLFSLICHSKSNNQIQLVGDRRGPIRGPYSFLLLGPRGVGADIRK